MRRALRWTLRIVLGAIALAVVGVIAAVIALHTAWGRELVRKNVEAALQGTFPGSKVASIEPALFGTTTVHGLVLAGEGGAEMVHVDTIEAEVGLAPLVTKTVRIDRLALDGVVFASAVHLAPKPEPQPPQQPSGGGSSWSLEFDRVTVRNAKITGEGGAPLFDGAEVDAAAALQSDGQIRASARVAGTFRGKKIVAMANLRRAGDILEVPLATVLVGHERLSVLGAGSDGKRVHGTIMARAAARSIEELVPGVRLGKQVGLVAETHEDGTVIVTAESGDSSLRAMLAVDPKAMKVQGVITGEVPDASALVRGGPPGGGAVLATIAADRDHAAGIVALTAQRDGHTANALLALDATRANAWLSLEATTDLGSRTSLLATLARKGDTVELAKATLLSRSGKLDVAPKTRVGGTLVDLTAKGRVWPDPDVRIDGGLDARAFAADRLTIDGVLVRLENVHAGLAGVHGAARVEVTSAKQAGAPLGSLVLDAHGTAGKDGAIAIDLDSHTLTSAKSGVWRGAGGHVTIDGDQIALRHFHTGNGTGSVDADGTFDRATGNASAHVDAKSFTLAMLGPPFAGTVGGTATIARKQGRWDGTIAFTGRGVVVDAARPPLDATGSLAIHGRKLDIAATAASPTLGTVKLAGKLVTPADPIDAAAWKRSGRSAIESVQLALGNVQLAGASPALTGTLDGDAELTATGAGGTLHLRGLHTKAGDVESDITFGPDEHGHVVATVVARAGSFAAVNGEGELALPAHPFDPAAWRALGRDALAGGDLHAKDVGIDPDTLLRLGVHLPYRARVDFDATLATGATSLTATLGVRDLHGGALVKPVELAATVTIDEHDLHASASGRSASVNLFALEAHSPITIDSLRTVPITAAPLEGTLGLPSLQPAPANVRDLLAIVGRDDILGGTLAGNVTIAGTLGAPTAHASLTAQDVSIRASVEGRAPAKLAMMVVDARWDGAAGQLDIVATETGKSALHVMAHGSPRQLAAVEGSIDAREFDLAPVTAFLPGAAGAARGMLEASLQLRGIDPATGDLHGTLHVHDARIPLNAVMGTLRKGDLDLLIGDHVIDGKVSGKLGSGEVGGAISIKLTGSSPSAADAELDLKKISLIRAKQPVIDAHVEAHFKHTDHWGGDIEVSRGHVLVPAAAGHKLLESSAPSDILFVDAAPKISPWKREPPSHPWLVANILIRPTLLDVQDEQYQVSGSGSGKLTLSVGSDGIGAEGKLDAERGDIQLFGQRSQLDHGTVEFDGGLDPRLDIRVVRDLDTMVVTVDVGGRASLPTVEFSSDTGSYSQGELLAFFVGGTAGGDRSEVGQAAVQAGAGIASQFLSKRLNKLLPIKLDIDMRYEAATSSNSEAIGFGKSLGRDTYVEYRQHVEARPDENQNEGMIEYRIRHTDWRLRGEVGDRNYDSGEIEHRWHW